MRRDGKILGWGLAGASWVAMRLPCTATVEFCANGRLCVRCGTQDIGTGTYTIFAQVLHEKTGVPLDRIDVIIGDSGLPAGPMSGGSMVTGSVLNAIASRRRGAIKRLQQVAVGHGGLSLITGLAGDASALPADGCIARTSRRRMARISPTSCRWRASTA